MRTKTPYACRWLACGAIVYPQTRGRGVNSVHRCFAEHPDAWFVTSRSSRRW
jgi:hypothetical protein